MKVKKAEWMSQVLHRMISKLCGNDRPFEQGIKIEWMGLQEIGEIKKDERGLMIWIGERRIQDYLPEEETSEIVSTLKNHFQGIRVDEG